MVLADIIIIIIIITFTSSGLEGIHKRQMKSVQGVYL